MGEAGTFSGPASESSSIGASLTFEAFYDAEADRLFRALRLLTGRTFEAEDLVQEAFVRVWERWDRVGSMEDPTGYLYRTAMNLQRSAYRRALRSLKQHVLSPASTDDPPTAIEARDVFAVWLAGLTPRQREAVILTQLVGQSVERTATTMGVRPGTVHALTSQARRALTDITEEQR